MIWNHPAHTTFHKWVFQISTWLRCYFAAGRFWWWNVLSIWSFESTLDWFQVFVDQRRNRSFGFSPWSSLELNKNHHHLKVWGFSFQIPEKNAFPSESLSTWSVFASGIWGANLAISPCCSSPNGRLHPYKCYSLYPYGPASCDSLPADHLPPWVSWKTLCEISCMDKKKQPCFFWGNTWKYWLVGIFHIFGAERREPNMCSFFCHVVKKIYGTPFSKKNAQLFHTGKRNLSDLSYTCFFKKRTYVIRTSGTRSWFFRSKIISSWSVNW